MAEAAEEVGVARACERGSWTEQGDEVRPLPRRRRTRRCREPVTKVPRGRTVAEAGEEVCLGWRSLRSRRLHGVSAG